MMRMKVFIKKTHFFMELVRQLIVFMVMKENTFSSFVFNKFIVWFSVVVFYYDVNVLYVNKFQFLRIL